MLRSPKKRILGVIQEKMPSLLISSSEEELMTLQKDLEEVIKRRRLLSSSDRVMAMIDAVKVEYDCIEYGSDWKDSQTATAVHALEDLDFLIITTAIYDLVDVDEKWAAAIRFTEVVACMIVDAEESAGKMVNGSIGEWCPKTSRTVDQVWEKLVDDVVLPSMPIAHSALEEVPGCTGVYDYRLNAIFKKLEKKLEENQTSLELILQPPSPPLHSPHYHHHHQQQQQQQQHKQQELLGRVREKLGPDEEEEEELAETEEEDDDDDGTMDGEDDEDDDDDDFAQNTKHLGVGSSVRRGRRKSNGGGGGGGGDGGDRKMGRKDSTGHTAASTPSPKDITSEHGLVIFED